jgi:hypothetical protein
MRLEIDGTLLADTEYVMTINTYGAITDPTVCANVGSEFNPLREVDAHGVPNAFQDPSRGRLDSFTTNASGEGTFRQDNVL